MNFRFLIAIVGLICVTCSPLHAKDMTKEADKLIKSIHKQWEKQHSYTAEITYTRTAGIADREGQGRFIRKAENLRLEIQSPFEFIHDFTDGVVTLRENGKESVRDMTPIDVISKEIFYGIGDVVTLTQWYNMTVVRADKNQAEIELTVKEGSPDNMFPRGRMSVDTKNDLVTEIAFFRRLATPIYVARTTYVKGPKKEWFPEKATFTMFSGVTPALAYEVIFKNQLSLNLND